MTESAKPRINSAHLPWRQSDQKFFVADNSKAHRLIQWEPVTTKEQGIESVLNWEAEAAKL
jgi:CDP-paratose 2-epimerase